MKKKLLLLLLLIFEIFSIGNVKALTKIADENLPSNKNGYYLSDYDYTIDKYDINVIVNKDNTYDVTENMTSVVTKLSESIRKIIPYKNTNNKEIIELSNVKSNYYTKVKKKYGNYYIYMLPKKDPDINKGEYFYGTVNTTLKYKYNAFKDNNIGYDEFIYNILNNYKTLIGNISFKITFPTNINKNDLVIKTTKLSDSKRLTYQVNNNVLTGFYKGILNKNYSILINYKLKDNYFTSYKKATDYTNYIYLISSIILIVIFILWLIFGRDKKLKETKQIYPPDDLNPLNVKMYYKNKVTTYDMISLFYYLASKGYFKINVAKRKGLLGRKKISYTFEKGKVYDGYNEVEKRFIDSIFKWQVISKASLECGFLFGFIYDIKVLRRKNNKYKNRYGVFLEKNNIIKIIILLLFSISFLTVNGIPASLYGSYDYLINSLLNIGLAYLFLITLVEARKQFWLPIALFSIAVLFYPNNQETTLYYALKENAYLVPFIYGTICNVLELILLKLMNKRNDYGNKVYSQIKGLKRFLKEASKEEIDSILKENPNYFYEMLPYAYELDVSKNFMNKFKSIDLQKPDWYISSESFSVDEFIKSFYLFHKQIKRSIVVYCISNRRYL